MTQQVETRHQEWVRSIKGRHFGERLWVICTGPSLRKEIGPEINRLENELCFGVNLLAHCITGEDGFMNFVPGFWGACEIDFLRNIDAAVTGYKTERILCSPWGPDEHGEGGEFSQWNWVKMDDSYQMWEGAFQGFGDTLEYTVHSGGVLFDCAVPMAAWMGFDEVYIIGAETTPYGHAYPDVYEPPDRLVERQGRVQASAKVARAAFEREGKKLIDLSGPTGTLPLEKGDFREITKGFGLS